MVGKLSDILNGIIARLFTWSRYSICLIIIQIILCSMKIEVWSGLVFYIIFVTTITVVNLPHNSWGE